MTTALMGIQRRLRLSGILLILGLGVELISLLWERAVGVSLVLLSSEECFSWPALWSTYIRSFRQTDSLRPVRALLVRPVDDVLRTLDQLKIRRHRE